MTTKKTLEEIRDEFAEKQAERVFGEYSELMNEEEINAYLAIVTDVRIGFDASTKHWQAITSELVSALDAISDYINLHRIRQKDWDVQYLNATEERARQALAAYKSIVTLEQSSR